MLSTRQVVDKSIEHKRAVVTELDDYTLHFDFDVLPFDLIIRPVRVIRGHKIPFGSVSTYA